MLQQQDTLTQISRISSHKLFGMGNIARHANERKPAMPITCMSLQHLDELCRVGALAPLRHLQSKKQHEHVLVGKLWRAV